MKYGIFAGYATDDPSNYKARYLIKIVEETPSDDMLKELVQQNGYAWTYVQEDSNFEVPQNKP